MAREKSVLVGLSGGVDSAMTAFLLKEKGYQVTGVHFKLFEDDSTNYKERLDFLANKLEINWIEYDATDLFRKEIIGYFTGFHLQGLTPSPCSYCNPAVKWKLLQDIADAHQLQYISSGHYIRIIEEHNLFRIYRGIDKAKDQSYYLWRLNQDILRRVLTPLGEYNKTEVKKLASAIGLEGLSGSKESAGLCFARGRSCEEMLLDYIPDLKNKITPGIIVDRAGKGIGTQKGYIYYTIGQKKDLNIWSKEKLCVAVIDSVNNIIVADTWQNLYQTEFIIHDFEFADLEELETEPAVNVLVRGFGLNPAGNARTKQINDSQIKVTLENPAWAIAPGQPAVFYSGDKLVGGGIIV
jgi:tRNA-uridine 2-sulfurtransferase